MALEDLTGTAKFVTALNPAWPVDDDWVDEGDNHLRGIKNVLKNTFSFTGALPWTDSQVRFPDGTAGAPGISWVNDPDSGWYRAPGGEASYSVNGAPKLTIASAAVSVAGNLGVSGGGQFGGQVKFPDGTLSAPAISWVNDPGTGYTRNGANGNMESIIGGVLKWSWNGAGFYIAAPLTFTVNNTTQIFKGWLPTPATLTAAPLLVQTPDSSTAPGICLSRSGVQAWSFSVASDLHLNVHTSAASGPAALGGAAAIANPNGSWTARSWSVATLVRAGATPLTGALEKVLRLRGTRYRDEELGREAIGLSLDGVEAEYPEVLSEAGGGKSIDYMALTAPLLEAVRELEARVAALEAGSAGS